VIVSGKHAQLRLVGMDCLLGVRKVGIGAPVRLMRGVLGVQIFGTHQQPSSSRIKGITNVHDFVSTGLEVFLASSAFPDRSEFLRETQHFLSPPHQYHVFSIAAS
jgi:hypothetical protein